MSNIDRCYELLSGAKTLTVDEVLEVYPYMTRDQASRAMRHLVRSKCAVVVARAEPTGYGGGLPAVYAPTGKKRAPSPTADMDDPRYYNAPRGQIRVGRVASVWAMAAGVTV